MAYTSIIPVHRLDNSVDYVLDLLDGQHVGHGLQAVLIP